MNNYSKFSPSSSNSQPIPVNNSNNPQGNNVYNDVGSNNMHSAGTLNKSIILKISSGADIIQSVVKLACDRSTYVTVVSGDGFVSEFDIHNPGSQFAPVKISGYFRIVSFEGSCDGYGAAASYNNVAKSFSASVANEEGEMLGGFVTSMKADGLVTLVIATSDVAP